MQIALNLALSPRAEAAAAYRRQASLLLKPSQKQRNCSTPVELNSYNFSFEFISK